MKILFVDNGTKYSNELKSLLKTAGEVTVINDIARLDNSHNFDLVVLSGGHQHSIIGHHDYYQKEINFIKNCNQPLLGICLGAELIAYTFGAKLEHLDKDEKGIKTITVLQNDGLFNDLKDFKVFESHKWAITKLSDDLLGLAKSQDGYEVIKHKDLLIYGFQFHPEMFENKTVGAKIFNNFLKLQVCYLKTLCYN